MDSKQIVELRRKGDFNKIVEWADGIIISDIDDSELLFFIGEAYENTGKIEKSVEAYDRALREFSDELVVEKLGNIYRQTDDVKALTELADYLLDEGLSDQWEMLARFEILRINQAPLAERIEALTEYVEEFDDEIYYVLLLEYLMEKGDMSLLERYMNKYSRLFLNSNFKDYVEPIKESISCGRVGVMERSIKTIIYAKTLQTDLDNVVAEPTKSQALASKISVSNKPSLQSTEPKITSRIKTRSLSDVLGGLVGTHQKKARSFDNPPSIDERFQDVAGMKKIKDDLGGFYRVLKSKQLRQGSDFNENLQRGNHFTIAGEPGSGKTLVAEIIGQLLADFGVRGSETAITVEAREFDGNVKGLSDETLIIENLDRKIDQNGHFDDNFLWSIHKILSEHNDDLSVIITGSKDAIQKMFDTNIGIKNLISNQYEIDKYSNEDLINMFDIICAKQRWVLTDEAHELVKKQLSKEKKKSTFQYGTDMYLKLDKAAKKAADRMHEMDDPTDEDLVTLVAEDFEMEGAMKNIPEIIDKLDNMVGLASVKEQVNKLIETLIAEKEAEKAGVSRDASSRNLNMLFLGNPGTGKTTVARMIADIYMALEVLPGNDEGLIEVSASDLVGQYVGETALKTKAVINRAMGGVLFVDEAYRLTSNQFGKEAVDEMLLALENYRDSIMFIFAGYTKEMNDFVNLNPGIKSRVPTKVTFEDYDESEMVTIFKNMLKGDGYIADKGTTEIITELIKKESKGKDFGNARGVRNLMDLVKGAQSERLSEMIFNGNVPTPNDYMIIRQEDIEAVLNHSTDGAKTLEELIDDLNSLEGLEDLKEIINHYCNSVLAAEKRKELGGDGTVQLDSLHMVFTGSPGTGKTTVARKIGLIFKRLGILSCGDTVIECSRGDLVGKYSGQTAPLVNDHIDRARGGVLFIDEAYTLNQGDGDIYGKEAIDALVAPMENERGKFMVILAGYTKEMNEFLDTNPGLRSRVAHIVDFKDFSTDSLVNIFISNAKKGGYTIEDGAIQLVRRLIEERSKDKDFGNARGVRKVYQEVLSVIDSRIVNSEEPLSTEDIKSIKKQDIGAMIDVNTSDDSEKTVDELLAELDDMIGLQTVKDKVRSIIEGIQYAEVMKNAGLECDNGLGSLHLLFKGNAGTGKTTVAAIIGKLYKQLGVLRTGTVVDVKPSELIRGYVGQTGINTQEYVNKALGGILFVDEAYGLIKEGSKQFGEEALTVILADMENHRDDLMVVFAGYPREIDELIASNQGFESRFPKQNEIIFDDYTDDELLLIAKGIFTKKKLLLAEGLDEPIRDLIRARKAASENFGNARGVRNIADEIQAHYKSRIIKMSMQEPKPTIEELRTIILEDVLNCG